MRVQWILPALLLALLLAAVALGGGTPERVQVGLGFAAGALALLAVFQRELPAPAWDSLVVALAWGGLAGAQIFWSVSLDAALDAAGSVLTAALVFLIASSVIAPRARRPLLIALALAGAVVAGVGIAGAEAGTRASLPFGNPNHLAGWLLLPAAVAFAGNFVVKLEGRTSRHAVLWFAVLGLVCAGIAATGSRGATCAAVATACCLALLAYTRLTPALLCAMLGLVALVLAVTPFLLPDLLPIARGGNESSAGLRWSVYAATGAAALEALPMGVGLGGFAEAFAAHRPEGLRYAPRFAHSEVLHAVLELGVAFLAVAGLTLWLALRRAAGPVGRPVSLVAWGGAGAVMAVGAHALVDFPLHVPAIALSVAACSGLAWSAAQGTAPVPQRFVKLTLVAFSAVLFALAGTRAVALHTEAEARTRLAAGEFEAAEALAARGLRVRPARAELLRIAADAAEHAHTFSAGGEAASRRAVSAREAAVRANPHSAARHVELARTRRRVGDARGALVAIERAVTLDPAGPGIHLARARLLLDLQRADEAAVAARGALELHPLATADVVAAFLRVTGDPALAQAAVPQLPEAMRGAALALHAAGFPEHAAEQLGRVLALRPGDTRVAIEAAKSLRAAGAPRRAVEVLSRTLEHVGEDARLASELERLERSIVAQERSG